MTGPTSRLNSCPKRVVFPLHVSRILTQTSGISKTSSPAHCHHPTVPAEAGPLHDVPTTVCHIMSHSAKLAALTDELVESVTAATAKVGASICAPRDRC